jgi:SAM-dependent methyltransferase
MTDQELLQSTPEEQKLWLEWVQGLPGLEGFSGTGHAANGERIPYGCGPHNIKAFREILEIVKPESILEIGMNVGYSTAMWLELCPKSKIVSIEISEKAETMAAAKILYERYNNRFHCIIGDSSKIRPDELDSRKYDLIFIDGGHLEENVTADIRLAHSLNIPWIVLDDWEPRFGPGVQVAAAKFPLEVVKVWGNTCLLKWKTFDYYVDGDSGKDSNSGRSPSQAWNKIQFDKL